jgi:hypothetical protein
MNQLVCVVVTLQYLRALKRSAFGSTDQKQNKFTGFCSVMKMKLVASIRLK